MTAKIINLEQIRALKEVGVEWGPAPFLDDLPLSFSTSHCTAARAMLNRSVEALSFRSGVSVQAIKDFEEGGADFTTGHDASLVVRLRN